MVKRDSLRRRAPIRSPKKRFLIVCEGKVTEPCYFRQRRHLLRSLVELDILPGGDPKRLQQARDNKVSLAVSNPSFEIWALLHFEDQTGHIRREQVRSRLKKHIPDYDKELPCDVLLPMLSDATGRAKNLEDWHGSRGTVGANPYTGVHRLVQLIVREGSGAGV